MLTQNSEDQSNILLPEGAVYISMIRLTILPFLQVIEEIESFPQTRQWQKCILVKSTEHTGKVLHISHYAFLKRGENSLTFWHW